MAVPFEHCVGSLADTKELEYLSALLQTEFEDVRYDGTLQARDIIVYLRSRHGLDASLKYVEDHLIPELGGCIHGPSDVIDMVQILSIILIPFFRQLQEDEENYREDILGKVIEAIVTDTWGLDKEQDEKKTKTINKNMVRDILECYGEQMVPDDVVDELIEAIGGDGVEFNGQTLLKALTSDVQRYNLEWQTTVSSHFQDAMGTLQRKNDFGCKGTRNVEEEVQGLRDIISSDEEKPQLETPNDASLDGHFSFIYTAPSIDYCAETFRSQTFYVTIWLSLVTVYAAYFSGDTVNESYVRIDCEAWEAEGSARVAESFG
ncbi:MAG: hypothetical protein SGILL_009316, partial [Bacillariaceae sp.]